MPSYVPAQEVLLRDVQGDHLSRIACCIIRGLRLPRPAAVMPEPAPAAQQMCTGILALKLQRSLDHLQSAHFSSEQQQLLVPSALSEAADRTLTSEGRP